MNKRTYIVIAIIAAVVGASIIFSVYSKSGAPSYQAPRTSGNQVASAPYVVTYTDSGFSPSTITIPKGGTVIFKNSASDAVWVASNPHPIHDGYPTTGGCVGSTFDACKAISPGGSWSFTFTFVGHWQYHNHLNPGEGGTVIVQ